MFSRPGDAKHVSYALPAADNYSLSVFSCHWESLFLIAYKAEYLKSHIRGLGPHVSQFYNLEARYGLH